MHTTNSIAFVFHRLSKGPVASFEDVQEALFEKFLQFSHGTKSFRDLHHSREEKKHVICSFDDGYTSDLSIAAQALLDQRSSATFFVVPKFVGKRGHLSWQDIRELDGIGMEIGSHSVSHLDLTKEPKNAVYSELSNSKDMIAQKIGRDVTAFSFPFGRYNKNLVRIAHEIGYNSVACSRHGVIRSHKRYLMARNSVNRYTNVADIPYMINPNLVTIGQWCVEDLLKGLIRNTLPKKFYQHLRQFYFENKS
jgi:peptidoglycan/xylan/chitin deacetylase (PgdA/CDA1 family)